MFTHVYKGLIIVIPVVSDGDVCSQMLPSACVLPLTVMIIWS